MTQEMVRELVQGCKDLSIYEDCRGDIHIDVEDFDGFDENWDEQFRDYDTERVGEIEETLRRSCIREENRLYTRFVFDGFCVVWGYTSFDI